LDQALKEEDERSRSSSPEESMIDSETVDSVQEKLQCGAQSPIEEFHDAKAFAVLGADG
jgi:hypothetical protein